VRSGLREMPLAERAFARRAWHRMLMLKEMAAFTPHSVVAVICKKVIAG